MANGHRTYFQPGDSPYPVYQRSTPSMQAPPVYEQEQPSRRRIPTWILIILSALVSSAVTLWNADFLVRKLLTTLIASVSTPEEIYLTEQSGLVDAKAIGQKELFHIIIRAIISAPERDKFFDAVQDPQALRRRPLRLSDGQIADEFNAAFVRVFDKKGKNHLVILAVNTVEDKGKNAQGRISTANSWTDNSTPIQKWMIALELELRRAAMSPSDPTGGSAGITMIYITRDTLGVGSFGPVSLTEQGELTEPDQPHPRHPELAMMQCIRYDSEKEFGWSRSMLDILRMVKHERAPSSEVEVEKKKEEPAPLDLHIDRGADGYAVLALTLPDGSNKELARTQGEVTFRKGPKDTLIFMEKSRNGQIKDFFTFCPEEARKEYGFDEDTKRNEDARKEDEEPRDNA